MTLHYWASLLGGVGLRDLVPRDYPVIGFLPIDRPVHDYHVPRDPLLGYLPPPPLDVTYGPAIWSSQAYTNSFSKFSTNFDPVGFDAASHEFARLKLIQHFSFLHGSNIIPITATKKPTHTTCGYPKNCVWRSEGDMMEERGWQPYLEALKKIDYTTPIVWYLFLKKEILRTDKIVKGDIRQILCADPIFSRIGLMFDQHQNAMIKARSESDPTQVGWSPMYGGFQRRVLRLARASNEYWCEMDWTRFDGSIHASLLRMVREIRWSYIREDHRTPEMRQLYSWYVDNLVDRYVLLPSGEVTRQKRGNPSGQVSTSIDNCMINYYLQMYEYHHFFGDDTRGWDGLIYGDDRLSKIPRPYQVEDLIAMYDRAFGMTVKPENIRISNSPIGLSFCGFTIGSDFSPVVQRPLKLLASLTTPVNRLPDEAALCGKVLSLWLLTRTLPAGDRVRDYINLAYTVVRVRFPSLVPTISEAVAMRLWRGGPKESNG